MKSLPLLDLAIIFIYLLAMVLVGFYFSRKNKNAEQFTKASGTIPGWAIGISIYATFLSSNTFLGVPGQSVWQQLEFICVQHFYAFRCMDCFQIFCSFLPQHRRNFCLHSFGKTFWPLGENLHSHLFFTDAVGKNGFCIFWNRLKPPGFAGFFYGFDHDRNGNLHYHLYRSRRNGSRDMDGSGTGNYKNNGRNIDFVSHYFKYAGRRF